jgi:hypothetical protein
VHELYRVAGRESHVLESGASHDPAVVLHDHAAGIELELSQQIEQRAGTHRAALSVHDDFD